MVVVGVGGGGTVVVGAGGGGVVAGGTDVAIGVVGAGSVGVPVGTGVPRGKVRPGPLGTGPPGPGAGTLAADPVGETDPLGGTANSVGAGSPGPGVTGLSEEDERSATVAPTRART